MDSPKKKKKRKKKAKVILTPDERKKLAKERKRKAGERKFKTDINTVFKNAGFEQVPTRGDNFTFKSQTSEIDNIFIYRNIIVIVEDTTTTKSDDIRDHLVKKVLHYDYFQKHRIEFIKFLCETYPKFKESLNPEFELNEFKLVFTYASLHRFEEKHKRDFVDKIVFLDYKYLCYFLSLAKTIQKSCIFEILKFLKVKLNEVGTQIGKDSKTFPAYILPESPSGFPEGFKVVSFYVDPDTLIKCAYVLRKDGWRDNDSLYQRMLIRNKIKGMREYLAKEKRVFINNIIVTLDPKTRLIKHGKQKSTDDLNKTETLEIQLPYKYNSIGIIDGQHRVFAYHEGLDKHESIISQKRRKQHLLVTGIIYPENIKPFDRIKFEAKLFLEINDKQSKARPDLKQAIETIVNPFESIAISKSIIEKLSNDGPLLDLLEVHFFDKGKIKTASIVSYGLKHIVRYSDSGTLFSLWNKANKEELIKHRNKELLKEYIEYCFIEIKNLFNAYKMLQSKNGMWTRESKISRALSTTAINGIIYCLRRLIVEQNKTLSFEKYAEKLSHLTLKFDPSSFTYKSSHWKSFGDRIYDECFKE